MTAFTGVDSQNLPDVMVSVQFILAIGEKIQAKVIDTCSGIMLDAALAMFLFSHVFKKKFLLF
ncbi:hypothetical protein LOB12_06890 [Lactobacillus delbrueckii subsp. lactis]|nr:hypothetical protein [Lactobacillus delbrueckii subsp. lactis]